MWMQWHLFQYHLACVCANHLQSPTGCSPVIVCCYYVVLVSGVLAEIPPEPAHPGDSVVLPVFCGFVKKMFKSSVKRNSVPPSAYPPTGIQVSREETPTKILTDMSSPLKVFNSGLWKVKRSPCGDVLLINWAYIKHPEGETDNQANEEQFKGNSSDPKYEYRRVRLSDILLYTT